MELEVFDNSVVESHEQAAMFKTTLACLSRRDYGRNFGFSENISALDIDAWETSLSGNNDKTMDAAIGIADFSDNSKRSSRFLLVELRMNYIGLGQKSKTADMKAKNNHTRGMLSGYLTDDRAFFIFSKSVAPNVRSRISREAKVDKTLYKWKIITPEEFTNMFQFVEDLPYTPISPIAEIKSQVTDFIATADFGNAIKLIKHWMNKTNAYFNQYKHQECKILVNLIQELIEEILLHEEEIINEDNHIDILIAKEDIDNYLRKLCMQK